MNESMNSGCAVVANVAAGSVPYLIEHGQNGLIYQNKNQEELIAHVKYLLKNAEVREKMGRNAYETIAKTWNARNASQNLLKLCHRILGETTEVPRIGPGSTAPVIAPRNMYHTVVSKG